MRKETETIRNRFNSVIDLLIEMGEVKGLSDFSSKIDCHKESIGLIHREYKNRKPTVAMLQATVEVFGVDAGFFFGKTNRIFLERQEEYIADEEEEFEKEQEGQLSHRDKIQMEKAAIANYMVRSGAFI